MSSKERGGLSKREYAKQKQGGGMPSGDFYNTSQEIKSELMRQYSAIKGEPNTFQMAKDQYLASGGGQLDKDIMKAKNAYYDEGMDAMDKYSNIQNPNMRRALAEQSQQVAGVSVTGLTDERTRRQESIADYIATWSDTYGAKAKAAQGGGTTAKKSDFLLDAQETMASSIGEDGKADPSVYSELRDMSIKYGMSATEFDNFFKGKVGEHEYGNLQIKQPVKKTKELTEQQKSKETYYKAYNSAKPSEDDAVDGEMYVDDNGDIWQKVEWGSDKLIARK